MRLTAWGNAVLAGRVSLDQAADAIAEGGHHRVCLLPAEPDQVNLAYGLGVLRRLGVSRLRAVLPAPGDPAGLPGPARFNKAALAAGAAVILVAPRPMGALPSVRGESTDWMVSDVAGTGEGAAPDLVSAERELTRAVAAAAEELARLDVARWRPDLAAGLQEVRSGDCRVGLPVGHPQRAVGLAAQAIRMLRLVDLAGHDDGGALVGSQVRARSAVLSQLHGCARRALAASATGV